MMGGRFEKGIWIEESSDGPNALMMRIRVDTAELQELEEKLIRIRDLFDVAESMTTFWQRLRWLITGRVR